MKQLFTPVWRITAASMAAYILSQNFDVVCYEWLKRKLPDHLWVRNNGSTWLSQLIDTGIFCLAAFAGVYEAKIIYGIMLSTCILKIIVAAIDTPFIYLSKVIFRKKPSLAG